MVPTPEKVINVFAKKFSAIITKSYDCYVWGEFADYFIERFLNPFEKFGKSGGLDSEDEDQENYDRKSRVSIAGSRINKTTDQVKVRTMGLGEKYMCIIDTENFGYEWGLLSDVDHQENTGFIRYPQKITVLNQREFRNITAGPAFILSDTVLREEELSTNELASEDKTFYQGTTTNNVALTRFTPPR